MAEAFALVAEYEGTIQSQDDDGNPVEVDKFRGASFALRDGSTFDVAAELDEGDGVIVTDDTELAEHLRATGYLKTVAVPEGHPTVTPLESMTLSALAEQPEFSRIEGAGGMRKAEVVARMQRARSGEDPNVALVERDGEFVVDESSNGGEGS